MIASTFCKIMGVVLVIVGIAGFFRHDLMGFHVNTAHNIVHLASGALALWTGFTSEAASKAFSLVFGSVYLLVAILGFLNAKLVIDLLDLNQADNWLHTGIAALFLVAGVLSRAPLAPPSRAPQM